MNLCEWDRRGTAPELLPLLYLLVMVQSIKCKEFSICSEKFMENKREREPETRSVLFRRGGGARPFRYTPRISGGQMTLWSCTCTVTSASA